MLQNLVTIKTFLFGSVATSGGDSGGSGVRIPSSTSSTDLQESVQLPLIIREKDIEYQVHKYWIMAKHVINIQYPVLNKVLISAIKC